MEIWLFQFVDNFFWTDFADPAKKTNRKETDKIYIIVPDINFEDLYAICITIYTVFW